MVLPGIDGTVLMGVVAGVLVLAGIVKGVLGFGPALVSVPVLVQAFDPKAAIAAFSLPLLIGNLVVVWRDGAPLEVIRPRWRLVVVVLLTTVVGAVGLLALPSDAITLVVGVGVLGYLVATHRSGGERLSAYARRPWSEYLAGSTAGVLGGALGLGGLPLATYLDARGLDRDAFPILLAVLLTLNNAIRIVALGAGGLLARAELALGAAFVVPLFVGAVAGVRLRRYVPASYFEGLVRVVLLASALRLVYGSLA